jgi:hypothetical protein
MKIYVLTLALGMIAFTGCRKKTTDVEPQLQEEKGQQMFVYKSGMRIDTINTNNGTQLRVIGGGNQDVFLYSNMLGFDNEISDDEYTTCIWFPVDSGLTSFSYTDAQLKGRRCHYIGNGAWGGYGFTSLDKGTISGIKQTDSSWNITINITLPRKDEHTGKTNIVNNAIYKPGMYFMTN